MNQSALFDYSVFILEPSQVTFLEDCASGIESGLKVTVEGILEIGKALTAARDLFGDNDKAFGQWRKGRLPWLEVQTATNFMRVYWKFGSENLPRKFYGVENLAPSILYALAAPSVPDSVVTDITTRLQGGERLKVRDVKEAIKVAKSNVVSFPSSVVTARDAPQSDLPLPTQAPPVIFDANPMMRELGIPEGWFSFGLPFYRNLQSFYDLYCSGNKRDLLLTKFVQILPPDTDLTYIYQLFDFLGELIESLQQPSKSISTG